MDLISLDFRKEVQGGDRIWESIYIGEIYSHKTVRTLWEGVTGAKPSKQNILPKSQTGTRISRRKEESVISNATL